MSDIVPARSYQDDFDSELYYNTTTTLNEEGCFQEAIRFILECWNEVSRLGYVSGDRLLDVGTGASLISCITASRYVAEIHLSDLLPRHLQLLQRWLEGENMDDSIVDYVTQLENEGTDRNERVDELRKKVKSMSIIDVTDSQPIKNETSQFDVITSSFCLDAATRNVVEFKSAVVNVVSLLKKNGHIVLNGALQEEYIIVGKYKFCNANVSEEDVKSALISAGCSVVYWRVMTIDALTQSKLQHISNKVGYFVVAAIKT